MSGRFCPGPRGSGAEPTERVERCPSRGAGGAALRWRLGQAWEESPPPFAGGLVELDWSDAGLHFLARLEDAAVFTQARVCGERLWELGDVLEIFLRAEESDRYLELHVAPNGCTLQLDFPCAAEVAAFRAPGARDLGRFLVSDPLFRAEPRTVPSGWEVEGVVEAGAVAARLGAAFVAGSRWRLSFSRYDAHPGGGSPVCTSTSPHARIDFHRQQEWRRIELAGVG